MKCHLAYKVPEGIYSGKCVCLQGRRQTSAGEVVKMLWSEVSLQLFIKALLSTEGSWSYFTSSAASIVSTTSLVSQGSLNIRLGKDLWLVACLVDSYVSFYQTGDESQDNTSLPWFKSRQQVSTTWLFSQWPLEGWGGKFEKSKTCGLR